MISVIIPTYNAEKTIDRCLNSISVQTYTDLEIIVVDNGSTDNTPKILNEWKKKDVRIKVAFQESRGPSFSRNKGLTISTGEYITFCDADDYIEKDLYLNLYNHISQSNSDIVSSAIKEVYDGNVIKIRNNNSKNKSMSGVEAAISMLLYKNGVRTVVWDKLYRRDCIRQVFFSEKIFRGEDTLFNLKVMLNSMRYSTIDFVGYVYDHRNSFLTKQTLSKLSVDNDLLAVESLVIYVKNWLRTNKNSPSKEELESATICYYLKYNLGILKRILLSQSNIDFSTEYKKIKLSFLNLDKKLVNRSISEREKIEFMIILNCPYLYLVVHSFVVLFRKMRFLLLSLGKRLRII
uniref:glycosyltransferase family 2 protein n=1 Tax=Succinivibrio sp. TaxID=2053619 RepID=UPI00402A9F64